MVEHISDNVLEAEIAELNREISSKRRELEEKRGIVSERGVLHEVIAEKLDNHPPAGGADAASLRQELKTNLNASKNVGVDPAGYLNTLSDDQAEVVNQLISLIPNQGIQKAVTEAKKLSPFLLDAFHDALVDKLYDELINRGLISLPGKSGA